MSRNRKDLGGRAQVRRWLQERNRAGINPISLPEGMVVPEEGQSEEEKSVWVQLVPALCPVIPKNTWPPPPPSYRGCWHGVSRGFFLESCPWSGTRRKSVRLNPTECWSLTHSLTLQPTQWAWSVEDAGSPTIDPINADTMSWKSKPNFINCDISFIEFNLMVE